MKHPDTHLRKTLLAVFASLALLLAVPLGAQDAPPPPDEVAEQVEADAEHAAEHAESRLDQAGEEIEQTAKDVKSDVEQAAADIERDLEDGELPATASPLPLILLTGLAGLGAAAGLRRNRR